MPPTTGAGVSLASGCTRPGLTGSEVRLGPLGDTGPDEITEGDSGSGEITGEGVGAVTSSGAGVTGSGAGPELTVGCGLMLGSTPEALSWFGAMVRISFYNIPLRYHKRDKTIQLMPSLEG